MDLSGVPLSEIRRRLRDAPSSAQLGRLAVALGADPRGGARSLAGLARRRLARMRAERLRLRRLFARRRGLFAEGARAVAGVDEVGVGPLAGPVVAAAVVLPERVDLPGLDDSKRLARAVRERLARAVREQAVAVAVASATPAEIDALNVYQASLVAMRRAVDRLGVRPDHVLVDARTIPQLDLPQTAIVAGDACDGSIAAASIVAKVYRDGLMRRLDSRFPGYGFARNMGYPTPEHLAALRRLGPTPVHRRSFAPVDGAEIDLPGPLPSSET